MRFDECALMKRLDKKRLGRMLGTNQHVKHLMRVFKNRKTVAPTRARSLLLWLAARAWLILTRSKDADGRLQPRDAEGITLRATMERLKASLKRKQHDVSGVSRVNQAIIH